MKYCIGRNHSVSYQSNAICRLVKRPEDTPDLIQQALIEYQLIQSELSSLLSNLLNVVILTLEATQLPEAIFYHFYAWYKLNFGRVHTNLVFPQKLPVPDSRIASRFLLTLIPHSLKATPLRLSSS